MSEPGIGANERGFPAPTAIEWLCLIAGALLCVQYAWLLDDAFIYYRYVDNLLYLGRGLVFNEGEFVEGYSSPLWCLVLVPLRWSGLSWWLVVRLVGVATWAATWALLVVLNRKLAPRNARVVNLPLLYLAFNYATQTYFTSGVEAPFVQLVAVACALFCASPSSRVAGVLLGLAPMVRHELALPFAIACAWAWWSTRRVPWIAFATCALTLGGWLVFRVGYYAELLPNTFYLKDEVHWSRGFAYLHDTARSYGTYLLVPLLAALAWVLRASGVRIAGGARLVMLASAAAVTLYVAKIGGDPRHYRYLAFPFVLLACASAGLVEHALERWGARLGSARIALSSLLFAALCFSLYPRQLSKHPIARDAEHTKLAEINDAQYHRLKKDIGESNPPWGWSGSIDEFDDQELDHIYGDDPLLRPGPVDARDEYRRWRASGQTSRDYPVRKEGWCATAFFSFTQTIVHHDGLTDPILARVDTRSWRAAHKRELHDLAVDVVALRNRFGSSREGFEAALSSNEIAPWMAANRVSIELLARKAFNRHDWGENLALAFTRIARIEPGE